MNQHTQPRSFTLVEVLIALALGVLLALGVQSLTLGAYRVSTQIQKEAAHAAARCLAFDILAQDLSNLPAGGGIALGNGALVMTTLNSMAAQRPVARHAVTVQYRILTNAVTGKRLVRWEGPLGSEPLADSGVSLTDTLQSAEFKVFDGQKWQSTWPPATPQVARALRVSVTWTGSDQDERIVPLTPLRWRSRDE